MLVPCTTPTTIIQPTSTSATGILPPGGNIQQTMPTPTPTWKSAGGTSNGASLPPATPTVVPSPTTVANTAYNSPTITGQDNGKMLMPTTPEIAIGSSVLGAAALLGWYVWRRRQGGLSDNINPIAQTFQSNMTYAQPTLATNSVGMVQEQGAYYQAGNGWLQPEASPTPQVLISNADASLEAIMRQAQLGLFALPNKEEYS